MAASTDLGGSEKRIDSMVDESMVVPRHEDIL